MPNINDAFPSKYLKAADLQGREPVVIIDRVDFEPVGRSREMKPIVYFRGKEKGIVLNKTNANKIVEISGSAITEEWSGTSVKLFTAEADFGGDTYDVVRVKSPNGKLKMSRMSAPPAPPVHQPEPEPVHDDTDHGFIDDSEIPF